LLFGQQIDQTSLDSSSIEDESGEKLITRRIRRRHQHGRQQHPEHLERIEIEHDLDDKVCPACGTERCRIGQEASEQLEYFPASFKVLRHIHHKYACRTCDHDGYNPNIAVAQKPAQPIDKGLPGPGLLAYIITSRLGDHLPLYRLGRIFERLRVHVARSTICAWMRCAGELVKRLVNLMAEREAAFAVHGFDGRAWFNTPRVIFERRTVVKQIEIEGDTEGQDTVRRETTERVAQGYGLIGLAGVQMELTVEGQAFGKGVMQKDTDAARLLENVSPQREADQLQRERQELEQTKAQREQQRGQRQERWDKQSELDTARQQLEALQFEMAGGEAEGATISKGDVVNAFPGAFVEEIAYGYRVKLGKHSPRVIEVRVVPDIEIDWPAVEKELGREIPAAERATLTAAGRFHFKATGGPNDAGRSGIGVIELVQGLADEKTLRHEALHAARVMGLFSMGQWHALVNKYSELGKSELEQEEDIAAAAEAWADEDLNLVERLRAWFYELLDRMGVRTIDAETVKVLMKHHTFWQGDAVATEQAPRCQFKKNRRVANPAVDEDARRLVQRVDALWEAAGEPEVRGDAEVNATADARLDTDPAGERARIMEVARMGGSLTDVETVIAKRIINVEAGEAIRSGDSERIDDAIMLIDAYRRTGTEQARAFRQRRETDETPTARRGRLIVESLLQPPRPVVEKIDAAREAGDPAAVERVTAQWRQRVMAIKLKLAKMGLDLDNIEALSVDELTAAKTANTISSAKAGVSDKLYEYWQNAILSGPTTHAANIVGNFFNASWNLTAQRLTEAMVNTVVQNPSDAQWGEFKHMLAAVLPGISRGARNFVRTWDAEQAFFEAEVLGADAELKDKLDNRRGPAIEGIKGRLVRAVGYRPLLAMDEFFKSIVGEIEASAHAYRIAKGEGLAGEQLSGRMKELLGDMGSEVWQAGLTSARISAFQESLGKAGQWVLKGRTAMPGLRYLIPFVTTPVNIFKTGLRKSPLGTLALGVRIGRGIKNGTWEGMTPALAEQMLAWAGVLALMWVIDDEDGNPRITGTEGELSYAKRRTARRTYPTQSIRLGDTWYSYARIEPFATALATTVDWIRALRSNDTGKTLRVPFESIVGQVKSKTFLSGLSDLLNALEGDQAEDKLARWASGFTTSWVPNLSKSVMRAGDDEYFERGIWGQGAERYTRLLQRTVQRAELPGVEDTPAVDLWGRHAPRDKSPILSGPITDYVYRLVVPVKNRDHRLHDADRALVNWNAQHPEDERHPLPPRKSYKDAAGEERYMTDAQYHQFLTLAGRAASMIAEVELGDVENPSAADIERIEAALRDGRKLAKAQLVKQWSGEQTEALTAFEIARQVHERNIVSHAANLVRLRPLKLEQRERWREQQQRAREFFEGAGIPASEAYDVYRRSLLRMRDPQQRVRKLLRLRANYPKEAA